MVRVYSLCKPIAENCQEVAFNTDRPEAVPSNPHPLDGVSVLKGASSISGQGVEGGASSAVSVPSLVDEFMAEWKEIATSSDWLQAVDTVGAPYPDYCAQDGGGTGVSPVVTEGDIEAEISKMLGCDRTALKFLGVMSGMSYYKFISCMKWFCEKCGSHGGRIHKRRVAGLLRRLGGSLDNICLRQFVFTLPEEWRGYFLSRSAINAFIRICENLIKTRFPGKRSVLYFHAFGDGEGAKYHPHVNVHVVDELGGRYAMTREELQDIKKALWRGVSAYIRSQEAGFSGPWSAWGPKMNFRYSFHRGAAEIGHKLKYMSRLHPFAGDFRFIRRDKVLTKLFVVEMKGFQYVRYFNGSGWQGVKDVDRKEEMREARRMAGEPLIFVKDGGMNRACFDLKFMKWDYEQLTDGFYRVLRE